MNDLIKKIANQLTRDLTYMYCTENSEPEDEIIFAMVYNFAIHLPYSMDIKQDEYVPADFFHMRPYNIEKNKFFWEDNENVYKAMISKGSTFKSAMLMQMCAVFQKMLSGQFPNNYELEENDFYSWRIDEMTPDEEYNKNFFEALKILPRYYERVQETKNNDERREVLKSIYAEMEDNIANRIGGFQEINAEGEVVEDIKPSVMWQPFRDLELLYYANDISRYSSNVSDLKKLIKEKEQSNMYKKDIFPKQLRDNTSIKE